MVQITLPVKIESQEQALSAIKEAAAKKPDLLELRLDYMPEGALTPEVLDKLLYSYSKEYGEDATGLIVTVRHKDEAGPDEKAGYKGTEEQRAMIFRRAIERGVNYIDIEGFRYEEILGYLAKEGELDNGETKLIVSHHNWEKTPDVAGVYKILKMYTSADVIKIVVQTHSEEDGNKVVEAIEQANKDGMPFIGIGLGAPKTRLHPGNHITYACLKKGEGTAAEQYTVEELRRLI